MRSALFDEKGLFMSKSAPIDPRSTRRTIPLKEWERNRALYATYALQGYCDHAGKVEVVVQKKPEFCTRIQG